MRIKNIDSSTLLIYKHGMSPVFLKLIFKHKFSHKKILHNKNFSILFEYTLYKKSLFKNTFLPKKEKKNGAQIGVKYYYKKLFFDRHKKFIGK